MDQETRLCDVEPGRWARVVRIVGRSPFKRRLLEMGLIRGQTIYKVKLAPLADPAEYIVKGYHISLRRQEAADVIVKIINDEEADHA